MVGYELLAQEQRDLTPEQVSDGAATSSRHLLFSAILMELHQAPHGSFTGIFRILLTIPKQTPLLLHLKGCRDVEEPSRGTLQDQRGACGRS